MKAIYYDTQTGFVTKTIESSEDTVLLNVMDGESYIEGELADNPSDYLVISGALTRKPEFSAVVEGSVISNIPNGTSVFVGLQPGVLVDDGVVELEAQYGQTVLVHLYNPAYIPTTLEVTL